MVFLNTKAALLTLASCHGVANALTATILADTNRDGRVDTSGNSDVSGKQTWTAERGALFLPNVVDTDRRCSSTVGVGGYDEMHLCHDATDNVLRQPKYLAPLRTKPATDASNNAVGTLKLSGTGAADHVRLFVKDGNSWTFVEEGRKFTAAQVKAGLELGIDGRDVRRPGKWDGRVQVHFTITDGSATSTDFVELRVAPFLTHHPVQHAEQVFVARATTNAMGMFNADMALHTGLAGIPTPPIQFRSVETWIQDMFETGYASIPGPDGPVIIRIMMASHQRRTASTSLFEEIRSDAVGAVNFPEVWTQDQSYWGDTWDSTGNLETIPPHSHNGKEYPAGRIIVGKGEDGPPLVLPFLELQETQDPLVLDTTFLRVGHVDEFIQFLPANNSRGWVVMADDPLAGLAILKQAAASGHGTTRAVSRPKFSYDPVFGIRPACVPRSNINFELARQDFDKDQQYAAAAIQANLDLIKKETGITDADIYRVPGLWSSGSTWSCDNDGGGATVASAKFRPSSEDVSDLVDIVTAANAPTSKPAERRQDHIKIPQYGSVIGHERRQERPVKVHGHYPSAINGVILSDSYYLSPNPWGPVIDGKDILAEAVKKAYAPLGFEVGFIDTWFTHHVGTGEVHCGTNVWREPNSEWW
jgi:protein-arginine deiminase